MTTVPGRVPTPTLFRGKRRKRGHLLPAVECLHSPIGMAPLITQGATIASALSPALNVWVPHEPNGASMIWRFPKRAHPRCRVRFAFVDVSSIETMRTGCFDTAGTRCLNQPSRCRFTLARRRSVAISDFFKSVAQLAKKLADGVGMCPSARCVKQGCPQLRHRDLTILLDVFDKESQMRVQLTLAFRRALRSSLCPACSTDRKRPSRSCGGREHQAQCRSATA